MAKGEISSLPVWAQQYIAKLAGDAANAQQSLDFYKAEHGMGLNESTVVADPHSECPRPLGKDTTIRFLGAEAYFTVDWDSAKGELDVSVTGLRASNDGLSVRPRSGNSVRLTGAPL